MGRDYTLFEAIHLDKTRWIVRPKGACGTIGWHPVAWEAVYVTRVRNSFDAITKAFTRDGAGWMHAIARRGDPS